MRVLVKDGPQCVRPTIGTDEDVVDVLARHEQPADIDLLALVNRLERIEGLSSGNTTTTVGTAVVVTLLENRRVSASRKAFELRSDRAQAPLADRADDDEVRRVDADPLRLRRGTPRQEDGEHETCATQEPTHRGPALL